MVNFMTSPVAQGGSFVQRQRMPWWSSLEADDDPRYRWTFDFFSTRGLVQGHGKSSWRSGTRPMFLGIAPGVGSWTGAGTVLDHVFLGFHYFHCLLCVCWASSGFTHAFSECCRKSHGKDIFWWTQPLPLPSIGRKTVVALSCCTFLPVGSGITEYSMLQESLRRVCAQERKASQVRHCS